MLKVKNRKSRKVENMDAKTFREFGKAAIDYVADYMETIREW